MKTTIYTSKLARLILVGLALYQPLDTLKAATISVCASGCDQTDVQAAIDVANPGDTVQLDSGIYHVNLNINKNVILQGQGAEQTLLDGSRIGYVVFINQSGIVELNNLTIQNGTTPADRATGGGIYNRGKLKIAKCIIKDNKATSYASGGGGIFNEGDLNIQYTTLSANTAAYIGGAILNIGNLNIQHTTISANTSTIGYGTAIKNSGGNVQIAYSAIVNNLSQSSFQPIAVFNDAPPGNDFGIFQSTISGNDGTAIATNRGGNILLSNTTIKSDTVTYPTLILGNGGVLRIINSIVVSPSGTPSCEFKGSPATFIDSQGGNITSDASCQLNDPTDQQNNTHLNLGPLQINAPGTIPTHALLPGSAAIDTLVGITGSHNCVANLLIDDQRGVSRPQGAGCDSGAFELRAPVATNDDLLTTLGQAITIPYAALMSNDESPDRLAEGNILMINGFTGTKNGTLLDLSRTKNLTYIPNPGFIGQDIFTYTVSDGIHTSEPATVTIRVQAANRPPVAANDSYSVLSGQDLTVLPADGVLSNDSDPDGSPLSVIFDSPPDQGTLFLGGDGSFTYTPNPGFTGTDSFTYKAGDGQAYSADATVTIEVKPATGTITIIEDAQPDSSSNFSFTGDLGNFILDNPTTDDGDLFGNSKTFEVTPGTHTINQTKLGGWYTGTITCTPLDNTVIDTVTNFVQVTVGLGDNKTCTFTNQRYGRLKVKVFNDLNKDRRFTTNEPGMLNWKTLLLNPTTGKWVARLTDSNGVTVFPNLKPGDYTVCEVLQPGWLNSTPAVLDPTYHKPCRKVTIAQGQTAQALFSNSQ